MKPKGDQSGRGIRNRNRNSGLFHFRGSRAGQRSHSPSGSTNAISVRIMDNNNNRSARSTRLASYANLITIKRPPLFRQVYPASKPVEFCLLNACSVKNKSFVIKDFVVDYNIDVLAMTTLCAHYSINTRLSRNVLLRSDLLPLGIQITSNRRKQKGES